MAESTKSYASTLNNLIETCKDGEEGFRDAAEHTDTGGTESSARAARQIRPSERLPAPHRTRLDEYRFGVVPMSGQRRLIRRRDCSDLSADWCAWQGYRLAAGRNNQRLSRKASSGSGGW